MTGPSAPWSSSSAVRNGSQPLLGHALLAGAALAGGDDPLGLVDRVVEVAVVGVRPDLRAAALDDQGREAHVVGVHVGEDEPADVLQRVPGGVDRDLERLARRSGAPAVPQSNRRQLVALDMYALTWLIASHASGMRRRQRPGWTSRAPEV